MYCLCTSVIFYKQPVSSVLTFCFIDVPKEYGGLNNVFLIVRTL